MSAKIILLAAGDIGLATGVAIQESSYNLLAIISPPPKPAGRGKVLSLCPAGKWGEDNKISCIATKSLRKDDKVKQNIFDLNPDIIVVADFGQIISNDIIDCPKIACINVHPSLLPKYRGAAPINWPLINGDKITGTTIMHISEELDAGDIILQKEVEIKDDDNAITLEGHLAKISGELLIEAIEKLINGNAPRIKQNESEVSWAPKICKDNGIIDWSMSSNDIKNRVRGLSSWPGTFTLRKNKILHIRRVNSIGGHGNPGEIIDIENKLVIAAGNGAIEILDIQPEGKKVMAISEFINGYKPQIGEIWGTDE